MARTAGLKTELVLNLTILLAAALLFGGFLLLKLTESELLRERTERAVDLLEMVARQLEAAPAGNDLRRLLPAGVTIASLLRVDSTLQPSGDLSGTEQFELRKARLTRETTIHLAFDPYWFFRDASDDQLLVTAPLLRDGRFAGALQATFPLDEVKQRLRNGRRVVLWYAALYGGVLFLFGLFQLTRNVIRPVTRLTATTRAVAGGDLDPPLPAEGPREIAELGQAFNEMIRALKESRRETSQQIAALEDANRELQRTRDDLVRSAKLASVGHLAAGMAHEIGNPLGAALGYLELLKEGIPPGQRELAERSLAELGRIDGLVKDLLDYAAPGRDRPEPLDATEVAREALQLLTQQGALDGIEVKDELPARLPPVTLTRHKLLQVLVNLLINARDATASRGEIRLLGGEEGKGRSWLLWRTTAPGSIPPSSPISSIPS